MRQVDYVRHGKRWTTSFGPETDGEIRTNNRWLDSDGHIKNIWLSNLEYDNRDALEFRKMLDGKNSFKPFSILRDMRVIYENVGQVLSLENGDNNIWDQDARSIGGTIIAHGRRVKIGFEGGLFVSGYCWDSGARESHNSTLFALFGNNNTLEIDIGGGLGILGGSDTDFRDAQYSIVKVVGDNNLVKIKMRNKDDIKLYRTKTHFKKVVRLDEIELMGQDRVKNRIISFNEHLSRGGWKTSFLDYVVSVGSNNRLEVSYY